MDYAKCIWVMEGASLLGDGVPAQIMGDLRLVTALIEICPYDIA